MASFLPRGIDPRSVLLDGDDLTGAGLVALPDDEPIGSIRCGNPEMLGDGSASLKLQTNRPLVFIQDALPQYDKDTIWEWLKEGHARWGQVSDWKARRILSLDEAGPNDYVQLVTVADLGGGGVLADQFLPAQGLRVLRMRINSRIRWVATDGPFANGSIDPVRTLCHETGHFTGQQHWPPGAPLELMEPFISQTIVRPQPTEARVSAGWFGEPTTQPPVPPIPTPSGSIITLRGFDAANIEVGVFRRV